MLVSGEAMARFLNIQFRAKVLVLVVALAIVVLVVRLSHGGVELQREAKTVCVLNEPLVEDLWFDSQDRLVTLSLRDSSVSIKRWGLSCKQVGKIISADLHALSRASKGSPRLHPRYAMRSTSVSPKGMPKSDFPYVVSQDGMRIAWVLNGILYVKSAEGQPMLEVDVGSSSGVIALSFSGENTLTFLREDGSLEHWDLLTRNKGAAGAPLSNGWVFWNQGKRLAVASLASGDIGMIDVRNPNEHHILSNYVGFRNGSAMALSRRGIPAIGTRDGKVVIFDYDPAQGFVVKRWILLPETRSVRSVVFFDENFLLVGGDFRSIFIVSKGREDGDAREVMSARNGARILALKQHRIAVSTPEEVILGNLEDNFRITPKGALSLTIFSVTISLLSIIFNIIKDEAKETAQNRQLSGAARDQGTADEESRDMHRDEVLENSRGSNLSTQ